MPTGFAALSVGAIVTAVGLVGAEAAASCPVACDVPGGVGRCALGVDSGSGACTPRDAIDERCNGIDDDCDGEVDEGPDGCLEGFVCARGTCQPVCDDATFACRGSWVCREDGTCAEASCADVDCPPGEACVEGTCQDGCLGVVCPPAQHCAQGVCVDPCRDVECGADEACDGGLCVPAACATDDCGGCPAGQTCDGGLCRNACRDVACPHRQVCIQGQCEDDPTPDAGGGGTAGATTIDVTSGLAGQDGSGGTGAVTDLGRGEQATVSSCAIARAGRPPASPLAVAALLALGAAPAFRRRRRR